MTREDHRAEVKRIERGPRATKRCVAGGDGVAVSVWHPLVPISNPESRNRRMDSPRLVVWA
ncbi:MAG: hypothetical protein ABIS00_00945 [Gemmatimonadales bacterium]